MNNLIYHGSPNCFDKFTDEYLKSEENIAAITAGTYFTTNLSEAMQYTKIDSGFIYSTVYDNRFKLLKIDNYKNQQEDFHLSKYQIAQLIFSTPDFLDRAYNFLDVDLYFQKNSHISENKICKNLANEIASNYMHFNDVLTLLNVLGNDFVHISDLNQFHKSFIKITGLHGFEQIYHDEQDNKEQKRIVLLDADDVNQFAFKRQPSLDFLKLNSKSNYNYSYSL